MKEKNSLKIGENSTAVFCKPRTVPVRYRQLVSTAVFCKPRTVPVRYRQLVSTAVFCKPRTVPVRYRQLVSTAVFCKPRTVPVRYRQLVKDELNRLVEHKIITKVFRSDWASNCKCIEI